jgi:hypothetical protein
MLTGMIEIEDIKKTYRELWLRGKQMLPGASSPVMRNNPEFNALPKRSDRTVVSK